MSIAMPSLGTRRHSRNDTVVRRLSMKENN